MKGKYLASRQSGELVEPGTHACLGLVRVSAEKRVDAWDGRYALDLRAVVYLISEWKRRLDGNCHEHGFC